jgi:tetratricopeptide (TPR) repeat protein
MALHDEAHELYERGEYRSAIARLEAALAIDPEGKELLYNLALIHERLGEVDTAERYYRRFLDMETEPKVRERVQAVLKRIEGAKKEFAAPKPAPPPAPAPAPPPPPPPAPSPRRVAGRVVVAGAVAVGAFLASGIFGLSAVAGDPGSHPMTGAGVSIDDLQSEARSAHTRAVVADVTFFVGALATTTAILLYTFGHPARPAARTALGLSRAAWPGLGASF